MTVVGYLIIITVFVVVIVDDLQDPLEEYFVWGVTFFAIGAIFNAGVAIIQILYLNHEQDSRGSLVASKVILACCAFASVLMMVDTLILVCRKYQLTSRKREALRAVETRDVGTDPKDPAYVEDYDEVYDAEVEEGEDDLEEAEGEEEDGEDGNEPKRKISFANSAHF